MSIHLTTVDKQKRLSEILISTTSGTRETTTLCCEPKESNSDKNFSKN